LIGENSPIFTTDQCARHRSEPVDHPGADAGSRRRIVCRPMADLQELRKCSRRLSSVVGRVVPLKRGFLPELCDQLVKPGAIQPRQIKPCKELQTSDRGGAVWTATRSNGMAAFHQPGIERLQWLMRRSPADACFAGDQCRSGVVTGCGERLRKSEAHNDMLPRISRTCSERFCLTHQL
jgi:hypothetical protein